MKIKYILIIIILLFSLFALSGCYDASSVETLAYAIAIGIDKSNNNTIKLTMQFAIPETSDSSSSSQASSSTVLDVDCSTIDEGIGLINSYISKKVNLSHCKAIVISEDLAYDGISEHVFNLVNNVQLRPDCYMIISRCSAYDFLSNAAPTLESVPARYYELILNSSEYTGFTESVYIATFYQKMLSTSIEAVAILGGVNTATTQEAASNSENFGNAYKADETPLRTENSIENMGLAVFSGDKLVGELNSIETLCHMIISNELENATITIPNPNDYTRNISLYINLEKPTKNSVKIVNDYPFIQSDINVSGYVLNLNSSIDLSKEESIEIINEAVSSYLNYYISSYLYKTSKEFKSDVEEFGKHLMANYLTDEDWEKFDWLNNYQNSFFKVNVKSNIISANLFNSFK